MSKGLQKMLGAAALIAVTGIIGIAAASAQTVRVGPGSIGTQQGYIDPYAAYAYSPGLRVEPSWEFSSGFDPKSGSARYRELRVKPGAPVDSCFLNRLVPDRC
jgi:hypothetical protein